MTLLDHVDPLFRPILTGWNTNTHAEVWQCLDAQVQRLQRRIDELPKIT